MTIKHFYSSFAAVLAVFAMLAAPPLASADPGDDWGWGMMGGGYGPGMMGYGYGPGMMGGGYGAGMMGYGYGHGMGMMGGYGPGMMGGYGMGPLNMLNLSDDQRRHYNAITSDLRKKHWEHMGKILEDEQRLEELYSKERPDPKAIAKVQADIDAVRRQMIEESVEAQNKLNDLVTDEQRKELREYWRGGAGPGWGYRGHMMGR